MLKAKEGYCAEAMMGLGFDAYIPCNKPAKYLIGWKGRSDTPIEMCERCADHNINNRNGEILEEIKRTVYAVQATEHKRSVIRKLGSKAFKTLSLHYDIGKAEIAEQEAWDLKRYTQVQIQEIEEVDIILLTRGVYKQAALYERKFNGENNIYAKHGSGFIRLYKHGVTSVPSIRWEETDFDCKFNTLGRMIKGEKS